MPIQPMTEQEDFSAASEDLNTTLGPDSVVAAAASDFEGGDDFIADDSLVSEEELAEFEANLISMLQAWVKICPAPSGNQIHCLVMSLGYDADDRENFEQIVSMVRDIISGSEEDAEVDSDSEGDDEFDGDDELDDTQMAQFVDNDPFVGADVVEDPLAKGLNNDGIPDSGTDPDTTALNTDGEPDEAREPKTISGEN